LLANADNADETYVKKVLPEKMRYNLRSIESFSFFSDIKTMFRTVLAVAQKDRITEKVSDIVASDKNIHL
jgi:lipopolysaccharide/colanic/teichoic acid biosynthesis glycosyltransferase